MTDRQVAIVAFYDEEGKILLQDREGLSKFGEEWGFFGGQIEEKETPCQALEREIMEELEYDIKDYRFLGKYPATLPRGITAILYAHIAQFPGFDKLNQKEGKAMKLFTFEETENLKMIPEDHQILKDIKTHISKKK